MRSEKRRIRVRSSFGREVKRKGEEKRLVWEPLVELTQCGIELTAEPDGAVFERGKLPKGRNDLFGSRKVLRIAGEFDAQTVRLDV
jgi:hypothetical protein